MIPIGETSSFDPILVGHAEYLAICTVSKLGVVSQTISTVPGQDYTFTFRFSSDGAERNFFQARWGNQVVMEADSMSFRPGWSAFNEAFIYCDFCAGQPSVAMSPGRAAIQVASSTSLE
jgi:hypothetical protein